MITCRRGLIYVLSSTSLELWSKIRISLEIRMRVCVSSCTCSFLCVYTSTYMIQRDIFQLLIIFLIGICVLWETSFVSWYVVADYSEMLSASIFGVVTVYPSLSFCLHLQELCSPRR